MINFLSFENEITTFLMAKIFYSIYKYQKRAEHEKNSPSADAFTNRKKRR